MNTLKIYIQLNGRKGKGETKLFLSYLLAHQLTNIKKVSRWTKREIKSTGININIFQDHSVRKTAA